MPALHDTILRRAGMLPAKNVITADEYATRQKRRAGMLPAENIILYAGYITRRKRQAECLPYKIRHSAIRVCYPLNMVILFPSL